MIIFRIDGNHNIGSGHVFRCLSIAGALEESCLFVMADDNFKNVILEREYDVFVLNTDYQFMEKEITIFTNLLKSHHPSFLFIDSYFVTYFYLSTIHELCKSISCTLIYIDDTLSFPYPCDILLNYNLYGCDKEIEYKTMYFNAKARLPRLLLGSSYAPLRREFQNLPERNVKREARNILISTGGADKEHLLRKMAEYISHNESLSYLHFHFLVGALNKDWYAIQHLLEDVQNVTLHHNPSNIQEIMFDCDVAISAAGSTLYELCATQTPMIIYTIADNQIMGAEEFKRQCIAEYVGDARTLGITRLSQKLIYDAVKLAGNYDERVRIVTLQRKKVDGNGADRIIRMLSFKHLTLNHRQTKCKEKSK